jgi:hypothetical protein
MYVVQIAEKCKDEIHVIRLEKFSSLRIFCDFDDHLVFYNGQCQEVLKILKINISVYLDNMTPNLDPKS